MRYRGVVSWGRQWGGGRTKSEVYGGVSEVRRMASGESKWPGPITGETAAGFARGKLQGILGAGVKRGGPGRRRSQPRPCRASCVNFRSSDF